MRDSSPYKTIAVATTFSPRFKQVLAEAKRIRDRFSADLHLIHVGPRGEDTPRKFAEVLAELDLPADSKIHYEDGDPAEAILTVLTREKIDVLIAGALEKEIVLHQFLGNVARRLVREATCSVMLFTRPQNEPKPLRRIVFVADHSQQGLAALKTTLMLAEAESCERLYVIGIITAFDEARASIAGDAAGNATHKPDHSEEDPLEEFVLSAGATEVPIETRFIRGATGLAASDFVRSVEADLLVVPLPKHRETVQQLPNNIAWVSDVIPCNLWIVR
ncbi:MAG TPA: universal stress protein [Candidatus Babeliales bacterium]|jgi:nucleotide-binding universal stress UspA family protein|nr:universal stress protein [Candidatus Babeliales bacterium]